MPITHSGFLKTPGSGLPSRFASARAAASELCATFWNASPIEMITSHTIETYIPHICPCARDTASNGAAAAAHTSVAFAMHDGM